MIPDMDEDDEEPLDPVPVKSSKKGKGKVPSVCLTLISAQVASKSDDLVRRLRRNAKKTTDNSR